MAVIALNFDSLFEVLRVDMIGSNLTHRAQR